MLLSALNFGNLNAEGYASFILALIFTIATFASAIYVIKHNNLSRTINIIFILLVPMIAIFCWVYLILTVVNQSLVNTLCISLACAVGYALIVLIIAFIAKPSKKVSTVETNVEENEVSNEVEEQSQESENLEEENEVEEEFVGFAPVINNEDETEEENTETSDEE